jgi:hypothetical protein
MLGQITAVEGSCRFQFLTGGVELGDVFLTDSVSH